MGRIFFWREISGEVIIPGEMINRGDLTELIYEIIFNCLTFSLPNLNVEM